MATLSRLVIFLVALIELVASLRTMLDASAVAAWRQSDTIWGRTALPFNVAGTLVVAIAYLIVATSSDPCSAPNRWRLAAFVALHVGVALSAGGGFFLTAIVALVFVLACAERQIGESKSPRRVAASEESF